jgi:hypothetical protein
MKLNKVKVIKSDYRGVIYDCGVSKFISRKKGTVSADHIHDEPEKIFLVEGKIELTIENETQIVEAPIMFEYGPNIYHKLVALTDIRLVTEREGE